jgi:hypothetical protein
MLADSCLVIRSSEATSAPLVTCDRSVELRPLDIVLLVRIVEVTCASSVIDVRSLLVTALFAEFCTRRVEFFDDWTVACTLIPERMAVVYWTLILIAEAIEAEIVSMIRIVASIPLDRVFWTLNVLSLLLAMVVLTLIAELMSLATAPPTFIVEFIVELRVLDERSVDVVSALIVFWTRSVESAEALSVFCTRSAEFSVLVYWREIRSVLVKADVNVLTIRKREVIVLLPVACVLNVEPIVEL